MRKMEMKPKYLLICVFNECYHTQFTKIINVTECIPGQE